MSSRDPNESGDPVVSVRVPSEVLRKADAVARARGGASRSSVVREALEKGLAVIDPRSVP